MSSILQTALSHQDTLAAEYHQHQLADVTGLQQAIANPAMVICDETEVIAPLSIGGVLTIDLSLGTVFRPEQPLGRHISISIINPPAAGEIATATIYLPQDSVGGHNVTWPASVDFGGVPPTLSGANGTDMISLITRDGGGIYYGAMVGRGFGIAPPPPPVINIPVYELTIGSIVYDIDLKTYFRQNTAWNGVEDADFKLTVIPGAIIGSTSTSQYALTIKDFPVSSVITIHNNGYIVGSGGAGAICRGGNLPGSPGGPALKTTNAINLINNGTIAGGGGGGSAWAGPGDGNDPGGGGGAGMLPGAAGANWDVRGSNVPPKPGTLTTGGAAGVAAGLAGGAGGNLGQPGGSVGGSGGAAGIAVTGMSLISWLATGTLLGPTQG